MIYFTNILIFLLSLIIWSADSWLWLAFMRLVLSKFSSEDNSFYCAFKTLTEPLPELLKRFTAKWGNKSLPRWFLWLITVTILIIFRYSLLQFITLLQD